MNLVGNEFKWWLWKIKWRILSLQFPIKKLWIPIDCRIITPIVLHVRLRKYNYLKRFEIRERLTRYCEYVFDIQKRDLNRKIIYDMARISEETGVPVHELRDKVNY